MGVRSERTETGENEVTGVWQMRCGSPVRRRGETVLFINLTKETNG